MLQRGDRAPALNLTDVATGELVSEPWSDGAVVIAFFKVSCPVCQLAAPKVKALADGGARVVAVGEDPPGKITPYIERYGQQAPTVSEPPPYAVSSAYGISAVPTIFLVGDDGVVRDAVAGWHREGWNRVAAEAGIGPVSDVDDGFPVFRPG